jgi:hypothetical protein
MALFLLFSRRRNRGQTASGPVFTVTPPNADGSPYPRPARNSGEPRTVPRPTARPSGAAAGPGATAGASSYEFRADNVSNSSFTTDNLNYTPAGGPVPSPFSGASEAISDAFSHFEPTRPEHYEDFFKGLPDFWDQQATTLDNLVKRAGDTMPIHPSIVEEMGERVATLRGLRDAAEEMNQHFRSVHADDLKRAHEPRTGEATMNYQPS